MGGDPGRDGAADVGGHFVRKHAARVRGGGTIRPSAIVASAACTDRRVGIRWNLRVRHSEGPFGRMEGSRLSKRVVDIHGLSHSHLTHIHAMPQIAFLGTGLLGSAFVEAAVARGDAVTVWNRTADKARALESLGVRVAKSPADAVHDAERVHLVLKDDAVVNEVIDALRPSLPPSAVIVDHTTTQPALTAERATRLAAEGVRYLHCPVFIGPAAAREGKGTILVAGSTEDYVDVQRALERMAEHVRFVGERPDLAAAHKLMGNCYILGLAALVSDVMAIGRGADVSPHDALDLLDTFNASSIIAGRGRKMADADFVASFELTMARKDVRLMIETAGSYPLAILPSLADRMDRVLAGGHGADDFSVIALDVVSAP